MKLYNTRSRKVESFTPLKDNVARLYSCGPTVYDHVHIGNLSAYIFADTLRRALAIAGYCPKHVMNYTDVDDKTIRRSSETYPNEEPRMALHKLTNTYIDLFLKDLGKLNIDQDAITFVRATDMIEPMKALITKLYKQGFAYIADDGIYFSIEAYKKSGKTYGQLLTLTTANTSEARIHNDEYDKESVHDFALWKKQKEGEPAWEYTLDGQSLAGRPGWHIECSVMSRQELGQPFDIHTGGIDLIFPHHENEIAQSTASEENPVMANFFAHNNHILVDGKKMAKSAQNFYTLEDITKKGYDPLAFRLMVLQGHYRSAVNFTWESLEAAQNRLKSLQAVAVLRWQTIEADLGDSYETYISSVDEDTHSPLFDDLDTPKLLANISQRFNEFSERLVSIAGAKGFELYLDTVDEVLGTNLMELPDITPEQKQLIAERQAARELKDWAASDQLRDQLKEQGIGVRDTEHGSIWHRI